MQLSNITQHYKMCDSHVGEHFKKMTLNSDLQFIHKESGNSMTTANSKVPECCHIGASLTVIVGSSGKDSEIVGTSGRDSEKVWSSGRDSHSGNSKIIFIKFLIFFFVFGERLIPKQSRVIITNLPFIVADKKRRNHSTKYLKNISTSDN